MLRGKKSLRQHILSVKYISVKHIVLQNIISYQVNGVKNDTVY